MRPITADLATRVFFQAGTVSFKGFASTVDTWPEHDTFSHATGMVAGTALHLILYDVGRKVGAMVHLAGFLVRCLPAPHRAPDTCQYA